MLGPTYRAELPEEPVLTGERTLHCRHCTVPTDNDDWVMLMGLGYTDRWQACHCPLCGQRYRFTDSLGTFALLLDLLQPEVPDDPEEQPY